MSAKSFAVALVLSAVVPPAPVPVESTPPPLPEVSATAWVLYAPETGRVLDGHNTDEQLPMASVTKMMTALVVRDVLALDERVRVSAGAAGTGEAEVGLVPGERWLVEDLLYALLVRSGNDAAVALAQAAAGSVEEFALLMNAKATELGLTSSSFTNPHGLDEEGHFSTAEDLARIGAALLRDPVLAEMVRTRVVVFKDAPNGGSRLAVNTNKLLGVYPSVIGVKTGFTNDAGKVLVAAISTLDGPIVSVVMGSADHFADSRELLEYGRRLRTYKDLAHDAVNGRSLPTGRSQVTELADTAIGQEIAGTLRSMLPAVLGGTG